MRDTRWKRSEPGSEELPTEEHHPRGRRRSCGKSPQEHRDLPAEGNDRRDLCHVHADEEILAFIEAAPPDLVAVDAPLSLPPGRTTIEDRRGEHFRSSDRELLKRGIRFFPITLGPMRTLTKRGTMLKGLLTERGLEVIGISPGGAQDIGKMARKQGGLEKLRRGL